MIEDEWNETPYFHAVYNYADVDYSYDMDYNSLEVDAQLEEKYRIPIESTKPKNKPSYRHLIRLYCKRCKTNSNQDFQNNFSKTFTCEKRRCLGPLSFQCITCDNFYKHLPSAYRHVRYTCKGLKKVIKSEVKTEPDTQNTSTKVYNPYRRKNKQPVIATKSKNKPFECLKCNRLYQTSRSLHAHTKVCGVEPSFKCGFCPFKTKYKWSLNQHVDNLHIKKEKLCQARVKPQVERPRIIKCVGRVKKRRRARKTVCKVASANRFCCEHCDYKIYRKDHLVIHMQRNHSEFYPRNSFTCKLCKKNCGDMYAFNSHMKSKCICRNARVVILNDTKV